jgi:hypothetical protein
MLVPITRPVVRLPRGRQCRLDGVAHRLAEDSHRGWIACAPAEQEAALECGEEQGGEGARGICV